MKLTNEQQLAFNEVRGAIVLRLKNGYCFTGEMLQDKSMFQLLNLLMLVSGARNYLGLFTATWGVLDELFGDAVQDKPFVEPNTDEEKDHVKQSQERKPVVH